MDVEQIIRAYLPKVVHLSLGTSKDGKPWVCEVHFAYDENLNLYFRSTPARRHSQEIAENPYVAGNIVKQHALGEPPAGIYFEGTAERLQSGPEQDKACACITDRLGARGDMLEEAKQEDGPQFYKISVSTWYAFGKFGDAPTQKYSLDWNKSDTKNGDEA